MKKSKYSEGQIVTIPKEAEAGVSVEDLSRLAAKGHCRDHEILRPRENAPSHRPGGLREDDMYST